MSFPVSWGLVAVYYVMYPSYNPLLDWLLRNLWHLWHLGFNGLVIDGVHCQLTFLLTLNLFNITEKKENLWKYVEDKYYDI